MPLYIDLHIDNSLTPDLVKQCHVADKAIQEKYGVRYLQILLNQPQGYLFCLVEGPDKESCERVHQEAHGNIACNILEITESDFSALLASKEKNGLDFTLNADGSLDSGNRALLVLDILGSSDDCSQAKKIIEETLYENEGRHGSFSNRSAAVFDSATSAITSAITIRDKIKEKEIGVELRLGIEIGPPLKESGNFFEDVLRLAKHFSFISERGEITVSAKAMQQYSGAQKEPLKRVKVINAHDEKFLEQVMQSLEKLWDKSDMNVLDFATDLGMSKSQLTRRLKSISTLSPNDLVREFRLRKSMSLIDGKSMNIAEITMAIGFTNPSYFTKCFRERFGKAPTEFMTNA